jgi:hypothetical protein
MDQAQVLMCLSVVLALTVLGFIAALAFERSRAAALETENAALRQALRRFARELEGSLATLPLTLPHLRLAADGTLLEER